MTINPSGQFTQCREWSNFKNTMSSGAWTHLVFLWHLKAAFSHFYLKQQSKMLGKQCETVTMLPFSLRWTDRGLLHWVWLMYIQGNLLDYVMLHVFVCGTLFILITGFINLTCDWLSTGSIQIMYSLSLSPWPIYRVCC